MSEEFEIRPWGRFDILQDHDYCKVKRLTIDPGKRISYQRHQRRTEHWIVVSGTAQVTLGTDIAQHEVGSTIVIERTVKHRLHNPGEVSLIVIEVQLGDYFGEDDIERFDDDFGRVA